MANTGNFAKTGPVPGFNKRLSDFRRQLNSPNLRSIRDPKVMSLLLQYARRPENVSREVNYLKSVRVDGLEWGRSIKQPKQLEEQIARFAGPDHPSFRWNENYQESLKAMKKEFSEWHLKPMFFNSIKDIKDALPKEDTHSGFLYLETGRKEKGDNMEEALEFFRDAVTAVKHGQHVRSFPILPGYRTQGSGVYDAEGKRTRSQAKLKTRLVSMVDFRSIVLELMFSRPFQTRYLRYIRYAGGKNDDQIHDILFDHGHYYDNWASLDYSHYDQSISSWLIYDAFEIIAASFHMNDFERRMYNEVVRAFICKEFITPNGTVRSSKGVPSGSMFTQIIDSIVNELMIRTVMRALNIKKYQMLIMGDDNIVFYNDRRDVVNYICSYLAHNFGVTANQSKCAVGSSYGGNFEFLSRIWKVQGAYRHPNVLISKLVYPERFRNYAEEGATPEAVMYSYCLAYPIGMKQLIDVERFVEDFKKRVPHESKEFEKARYITGYLRYQRDYLNVQYNWRY